MQPVNFCSFRILPCSEQIQPVVQIGFLPDLQLVFGLCQVIEQKLQLKRATQPTALNLEMIKPHGQISMHDVADADEAGVFHGLGESLAFPGIRCGAAVLGAILVQHLPTDRFIALFPVPAAKPATFVAQELDLRLLLVGQLIQPRKGHVQAEIRHKIPEGFTVQLHLKVPKVRELLARGGNEVQPRIRSLNVIPQQLGTDNHAILWLIVFL